MEINFGEGRRGEEGGEKRRGENEGKKEGNGRVEKEMEEKKQLSLTK